MKSEKNRRLQILVADDDEIIREVLHDALREAGFEVLLAQDGNETCRLASTKIGVALLDLKMPGRDGVECLQYIGKVSPSTESIVITASHDVSDAVAAMRHGAFDFVSKPFNAEAVVELVKRAMEHLRLKGENRDLRQAISLPLPDSPFLGESPPTKALLARVKKVSQLDSTVLITGESGVGKGLLARLIHCGGQRQSQSFVTVSCTSLPRELVEAQLFGHEKGAFTGAHEKRPGRVEVAEGGTLFLDEVGDLPLDLQPKLLTFLQDRIFQRIGGNQDISVDVRVVAATHQDLRSLCREKQFREDLFFRLNVLPIHIPPLRERKQDIPLLVDHFLKEIARRRKTKVSRLSQAARSNLLNHSWPGNVRELENVLERVTAFAENEVIELEDLSAEVRDERQNQAEPTTSLAGLSLAEIEKTAIRQTLEMCGGNKSRAARTLGISEKSIYNKMKRLGLY